MRLPASLLVLLFLAPCAALAQGDSRLAFLGRQLQQGKDPRTRSQAALVLGATEDPQAVPLLCGGLKDASELVRAAAAKSLAKLMEPSALGCLQAHKGEADAAVKTAVSEAVDALKAYQSRPPRLYLAMDGLKDRTGKLPADLVKATEARLRSRLVRRGAQLAPVKESKAAAKGALKKLGVQGFRITPEIQATESGGLRVAIVCMTYPDLSLMGQVEVNAAGAEPADLLKALVPKAVEEAAETFEWSET
ncbi:HEAT repeat domain-containing protein [Pyxidicoccus fallax]|uniref:HEAT repeat domain-containing protein n=1 Tax=Pyxidicoccus fallax TaxID=394095 RepID=A0A848LG35_9BACT|nr:HEAT repeat domain-containing protein [Pyxidicoccus fallax]NMO14718.1 HEAT repeat domain-containing protein [Pyxidicoccus fallax]NPC85157.1 HEAT repeat domain-containing protein [Pyxidicoccus fallax]